MKIRDATKATAETFEAVRAWAQNAHPFFWVLVLLLVPAGVAGTRAPDRAPGYALGSSWVYRLEVGGAFFLLAMVVVLILWLAYSGRSVRGVQLPGGAGVDLPPADPDLDEAAEGLAGYREKTDARLQKLEENIELLTADEAGAPRSDQPTREGS